MEKPNPDEVKLTVIIEPTQLILAAGSIGPIMIGGLQVPGHTITILNDRGGFCHCLQVGDGIDTIYKYRCGGPQLKEDVVKGVVSEIRQFKVEPGKVVWIYRPVSDLEEPPQE